MPDYPDASIALVRQCAEKYADATMLRAAMQLLPYIGGTLDTLIGGAGQKIQQRRMAHFLDELDKRLKNIEEPKNLLAQEDLYDLMVATFEQVVKTRSEEKRVRFAQLIANGIVTESTFENIEAALRLVGELDDIHIQILSVALQARGCIEVFDGLPIITFSGNFEAKTTGGISSPVLVNVFANIPESRLKLSCIELLSKGLLHDESIGRYMGKMQNEVFTATELASWLFTWINE
jgi:hypothetical protein